MVNIVVNCMELLNCASATKQYPAPIVMELESVLHAMEKNKLYAQFAMEIRNVYLAMEQELIPARIAMAMEIAQNAMMVGILATSAMVTEPWTVLIVKALVNMLIIHVISVEEVVIMIITITKFVERVVAPADL